MQGAMEQYVWNARISAKEGGAVRAYVGREQFDISGALSFDRERAGVSALEYALAALGAELVSGMQLVARKRRLAVDGIEATVQGELGNPLITLGVVGEEGSAGIKRIQVKVFVSTNAAQAEIERVWQEVLVRSPLAVTLAPAVELSLAIKLA